MTEPTAAAQVLVTFGGLFLIGLLADLAGRHTPLPRVTLLLMSGFLIGPSVLDWLPSFTADWFPVLTNFALAMIGFLLGQNLTRKSLKKLGRPVLSISLGIILVTVPTVFIGLYLLGVQAPIALLLAGIATATAPAATVDVVHEYRAKGPFTDTLLGIVAIDDAWGLLIFTLLLAIASAWIGDGGIAGILLTGAWEIGGAVVLGFALGLPMTYLTGRIRPGEPTQAEALGVVLLCAGIAEWLGVSYILSAMILGAVVANLAKHHERPFRAIEGIEWPFLILFFLLAGSALHIEALAQVGLLATSYIALRIASRFLGAYLGAWAIGTDGALRHWMGLALLPQAGVAIGMALLASLRFESFREILLPVVLGSSVIFELIGPISTRFALTRAGEIQPSKQSNQGAARS
ncbi:cation:proton antiporter [Saccharospirillum salsuginis]|uniref:Potassium transporter n=1 Tax=Saccharospirillum salsuginis TaxID=418750 RepID=A0A918NDA7_9GAMM|nr:cation:proton antiporter [Saccharospirillum salsuginis]GGX61859.1 potassium transporter [Saccharospirillum salsuginis]